MQGFFLCTGWTKQHCGYSTGTKRAPRCRSPAPRASGGASAWLPEREPDVARLARGLPLQALAFVLHALPRPAREADVDDVAHGIAGTFATALTEAAANQEVAGADVTYRHLSEVTSIPVRASSAVDVQKCIYPKLPIPTRSGGLERLFIARAAVYRMGGCRQPDQDPAAAGSLFLHALAVKSDAGGALVRIWLFRELEAAGELEENSFAATTVDQFVRSVCARSTRPACAARWPTASIGRKLPFSSNGLTMRGRSSSKSMYLAILVI